MNDRDTIVAIATPAGTGGIGVVRVSGSLAHTIAQTITVVPLRPRELRLCVLVGEDGSVLDRGLAVYFKAPASFTGEDVVELHAHGSPVVLDMLVKHACRLGARPARPGEFSERAFLNGKLDLVQAEAVADLIASGSQAAARAAMRSLDGDFSARVTGLFDMLVRVRAWLEAALDFPEEEIDFLTAPELSDALQQVRGQLDELLKATRHGVLLRDGLHVVIVGRPNAGKSSLLNALAQSERAIVTATPGTTRDVLRETVELNGVTLTLVDTAGLRESHDEVEREGVRRARAEMQRADVALLVTDKGNAEIDQALLETCNPTATRVIICNKIDLSGEASRRETGSDGMARLYVSVRQGDGIALLHEELVRLSERDETEGAFSARRRHVEALQHVETSLQLATEQLSQGNGELAAEELRQAQRALGEITGRFSSDDLLGAIFSSFCIGK